MNFEDLRIEQELENLLAIYGRKNLITTLKFLRKTLTKEAADNE
jgi:hypothetical protein